MNTHHQQILDYIGRNVTQIIEVTSDGSDFSISNACEQKAKELGMTMGTMCNDMPRGLARELDFIGKWRNIPAEDYHLLDGVVLCDNFRNGKMATIVLF